MNTNTQWHSSKCLAEKFLLCCRISILSTSLWCCSIQRVHCVLVVPVVTAVIVSGLQRWHLVFHLCDTSLPCFFQVSVYWSGSHPSFPVFIPKTACYRRLHRPKKNCIGKSANFIACVFCQSEAGIMSNTTVIEATGSGVNDRIVAVKRWDWQRRSC